MPVGWGCWDASAGHDALCIPTYSYEYFSCLYCLVTGFDCTESKVLAVGLTWAHSTLSVRCDHRVVTSCRQCCHLIWPTGIARRRDWPTHGLTDQPRPAALLWLVIQVVPQSFAAPAKIRYPRPPLGPPYWVAFIGGANFSPLQDWPVRYSEEYLYTSVV